jgi:hypothetical protein
MVPQGAVYLIGGFLFSAMEIEHAVLRAKSSPPNMGWGSLFVTYG